jgi:hypothetical protein
VSRYTVIPEPGNGYAGEYAAEKEPCSIGYYDAEKNVAAVAYSRGVEEAEVEEEDGDFGEGEAHAVGEDAEIERLEGVRFVEELKIGSGRT